MPKTYTAARLDDDCTLVFESGNAPLHNCIDKLVKWRSNTVEIRPPDISEPEFQALAAALASRDAIVL